MRGIFVLPEKLKQTVHEGFDPTLLLDDLLTEDLPHFLDAVLDHRGEDLKFVDSLKAIASRFVFRWVSELEDGFIDGANGVFSFLKENITEVLKAGCEPAKRGIVSAIGVPHVIKFIQESYNA